MNRNLDVKLLIGAKCLKALEPQEVISSQGDGPYAFQTKLGWCVVESISDGSYQNRFHCNMITVEDHATAKIAIHHFAIPKDVRKMESVTFGRNCMLLILWKVRQYHQMA